MKVVINTQFGGFSLSRAAYEKLIGWGVPVRAYIEQERDPDTGLFKPEPRNEGRVIFDRRLSMDDLSAALTRLTDCPYWDTWTDDSRDDELIVRVVEELGPEAAGRHATLEIVEVPDDVEWQIEDYDGNEWVAEKHRTWR